MRKPNGGVASALRAGFEAAATPYVFVLASDDVADAGALAELADALDARPQYDFAYGHSHHFGDVDFVRQAAPWNPWILLHSNLWEATCLFRREPVNAAGGFPANSGYEDWDLFMALAERGSEGLLVDRLVFHYRIHGGGRINPNIRSRFREHYATLRRTHAALFAREPELRRRYPLPHWSRLLYRLQLALGLHLPPGADPPAARLQAPPAAARRLGRRRAALTPYGGSRHDGGARRVIRLARQAPPQPQRGTLDEVPGGYAQT